MKEIDTMIMIKQIVNDEFLYSYYIKYDNNGKWILDEIMPYYDFGGKCLGKKGA